MGIDDNLVKLASFGTAGISILAVFITGVIIYKLPNDVSKGKTGILKFFIVACFIFVVLSTGTGIANAFFNKDKIDEKSEQIERIAEQYKNETNKWEDHKKNLRNEFTRIENQLAAGNFNRDSIQIKIKYLNNKVSGLTFSPLKTQQ